MDIFLLITKEEFKADKIIPQTTDDARVEKAIREAQQFDLRPLLGDALYYELVGNYNSSNSGGPAAAYQALMDGEQYTNAQNEIIIFPGLRMCLKYYAYARFILSQKVNVTTHSVVEKLNQYSQPTEDKSIVREAEAARSGAVEYWNEAKAYLNAKASDFPLWKKLNKPVAKGSIKISTIGGDDGYHHRYRRQ